MKSARITFTVGLFVVVVVEIDASQPFSTVLLLPTTAFLIIDIHLKQKINVLYYNVGKIESSLIFTSINIINMQTKELTIIDIAQTAASNNTYANLLLTGVNDHVIKISIMTEPYFWHLRPNSDESFLVTEGSLFIDLEDKTIELLPNQLFTIPANVKHRTRPGDSRSVNLTVEKKDITTIRIE